MARTREAFKKPCDKDRKQEKCLKDFVAKHKVNPVTKQRLSLRKTLRMLTKNPKNRTRCLYLYL